ncbi:MAG: hypothetical protein ACRDPR_05265, partial [Nocardioidaceae bacterium]
VRRHHAEDIEALRAALSNVAAAQETAITSGDRGALADATAKRRDAVKAVGRAVDQVLARNGRPAQYRDDVLSAIESGVTAEVASGTFGLRDDLELPDRPKQEPPRDRAAERRAADAKAAIEAAEARVSRARDELEKAESELVFCVISSLTVWVAMAMMVHGAIYWVGGDRRRGPAVA